MGPPGWLPLLLPLLLSPSQAEPMDPVQVFVIPHSHMEVGWIHTVQENLHGYISSVYNTVVQELSRGPRRRFIAVEQEYFRLWWLNVASQEQRRLVRQLVTKGRLEFVLGGQVMHDEAVTHMDDQILQLTEGHAFLYETFGVRPRFSWQVDPFGASTTTPTLMALAGFHAHVISRIDFDQKDSMERARELQFVWRASPSLGARQQIFTHVLDRFGYCSPGFDWEGVTFHPSELHTAHSSLAEPAVSAHNIQDFAKTLADNAKARASWLRTPLLLWPWGCDRRFFNAKAQFTNMDLLLTYVNNNSAQLGMSARYSSLEEYFQALNEAKVSWPLRGSQDFLPYSSDSTQAWTGFFASRSGLKRLARRAGALLYAAEGLFARAMLQANPGIPEPTWALKQLRQLRWAVSEVQSHHGITGTQADNVRGKSTQALNTAMAGVRELMAAVVTASLPTLSGPAPRGQAAVLYNPLAWNITTVATVTVDAPLLRVTDESGQLVCPKTLQMQKSRREKNKYSLYLLTTIPGLSHRLYRIQPVHQKHPRTQKHTHTQAAHTISIRNFGRKPRKPYRSAGQRLLRVENNCYTLFMDQDTNLMHSIWERQGNRTVHITQEFLEYHVNGGAAEDPMSDNYVFAPTDTAEPSWKAVEMQLQEGVLFTEVRQLFYSEESHRYPSYTITSRLAQVPRTQTQELLCGRLEQELQVGPLGLNREAVLRTSTDLDTQRVLYTDSNGYQMQRRPYQMYSENSIARNVFPLVQTAFIQDDQSRLALQTQQAHGVSSQGNGQLEVLLHRRLWNKQQEGRPVTLEEATVARATLWLLLGPLPWAARLGPRLAQLLQHRPEVLLEGLPASAGTQPAPLPQSVTLPPSLHLQTLSIPGWNYSSDHQRHLQHLQKVPPGQSGQAPPDLQRVLLRLHHLYEVGEDPVLSQPVTLDLGTVLRALGTVEAVEERSLTGTWDMSTLQRWSWRTEEQPLGAGSTTPPPSSPRTTPPRATTVTIHPKEIRTFFVHFRKP